MMRKHHNGLHGIYVFKTVVNELNLGNLDNSEKLRSKIR